MEQKILFSGLPTEPDVREIIKNIPVEQVRSGNLIPYGDIEKIIAQPRNSNRFRTVTIAWRKKLNRDHNIVLGVLENEGFYNLSPDQRITKSSSDVSSATRKIRRAGDLATKTPEDALTEEQKRTRTAVIMMSGSMLAIAHTEKKKLQFQLTAVSDGK